MTTQSPPKTSRLDFNTPAMQRHRAARHFKDHLTRWYVAVGGLGVIVAVLLIFLYLLYEVLPLFGGAIVLSALLVRHANALLLGDDMVTSLGMRAGSIKLLLGLVVIVLAGSSVGLAGMIGFVGLIVPHMARRLFGIDHRWMLPGCAVLGACLLLLADTASRFLIPPQEVPVGVMTALIGTPFFIYLARRNMARQ